MDKKSKAHNKVEDKAPVEKKPFFYSTIEDGVTVYAATQEEADQIIKEKFGA